MGEDPPLCCNCKGALCNPNILREVTDTAGRVDRVKGPVLLGCFFFALPSTLGLDISGWLNIDFEVLVCLKNTAVKNISVLLACTRCYM
jgi:hypothetical protein